MPPPSGGPLDHSARQHRAPQVLDGLVPAQGTKEKPNKKNQGWARGRARFAKPRMIETELPDDTAKWEARLRSWRKSHFWLPFWGPKPSEPDCWAPKALQSCM